MKRTAFNSTLPVRTEPMSRGNGLSVRIPLSRPREKPAAARTRKRTAPARYTGPDRKTRALVLERDGHACVCCGRSVIGQPYSLQHRKRRSQGGTSDASNLITVLGTGTTGCHERIDSRRDPHDEAKGYTVRSWDDPAAVGVTLFDGREVWLHDDGGYRDEGPQEAAA